MAEVRHVRIRLGKRTQRMIDLGLNAGEEFEAIIREDGRYDTKPDKNFGGMSYTFTTDEVEIVNP